jgi:ABC-type dipeptide/oligopeptide/nickel transport system permease subunit
MTAFFPWKRALHSKTVWFSLLVMLFLVLVAALAPWIAPHDPYEAGLGATRSNLPPMWTQSTSTPGQADFPLGTDRFGRDILSRLIYGTRTAFFLALAAVGLAALIGTGVGLISGYAGGRLDAVILYFIDTINSLPGIMFMVIVILILRSRLSPTWLHGLVTLVIGFAAVGWVSLARLVRINVLQIKARTFLEAARALGAPSRTILARHLLPNVGHVVVVWVINTIPAVILLEALLGYIGVGVTSAVDGGEFNVVSWGGMFYYGRSAFARNPLALAVPSILILLISMSFILLGDFINSITRHGQE